MGDNYTLAFIMCLQKIGCHLHDGTLFNFVVNLLDIRRPTFEICGLDKTHCKGSNSIHQHRYVYIKLPLFNLFTLCDCLSITIFLIGVVSSSCPRSFVFSRPLTPHWVPDSVSCVLMKHLTNHISS